MMMIQSLVKRYLIDTMQLDTTQHSQKPKTSFLPTLLSAVRNGCAKPNGDVEKCP